MKVAEFPLVRITIMFIIGIILGFYVKPEFSLIIVISFLSFFTFFTAYFFTFKKRPSTFYFTCAAYLLSFSIGLSSLTFNNDLLQQDHYVHLTQDHTENHKIVFILKERLKPTANNFRYVAEVSNLDGQKSSGAILVNFRKQGFDKNLIIGSRIAAVADIHLHQKPLNPDQFDYGKYLEQKSVFAQTYVSASDILVDSKVLKDWWYYSDRLRSRMVGNLERSRFGKDELGVINALILGQRQDIAPEIIQDYQFAGAIHILSVSGLHVGLLLLMFQFVLRIVPQNRLGNISRLVIIIGGLWTFALIAGFSPSVVRSVTMFSFVAVGIYLNRKTNSYHTLIVSMLIILLFKPAFLFDVGFQLSYLAVFFILWLQPLLSKLWSPQYKLSKYLWDILTVSLAAQLGTMPLGLYYFHQFPGLFFVTNLIILPSLGLIMAYGVIVLLLSLWGTLPLFLIKGLEWSIFTLNKIIAWIASFESFVCTDIPFNAWMMLGLYAVIFTGISCFKRPLYFRLVATLIAVILFQTAYFGTHFYHDSVREWTVFHVKKQTLIADRNGKDLAVYSTMENVHEKYSPLNAFLVGNFTTSVQNEKLVNLYSFKSEKILIIDSLAVYPEELKPDVVVLIQSPQINLDRLLQVYKPKVIVADGSNFKSYTARWRATCEKQKIPFHATAEKGFYRIQ